MKTLLYLSFLLISFGAQAQVDTELLPRKWKIVDLEITIADLDSRSILGMVNDMIKGSTIDFKRDADGNDICDWTWNIMGQTQETNFTYEIVNDTLKMVPVPEDGEITNKPSNIPTISVGKDKTPDYKILKLTKKRLELYTEHEEDSMKLILSPSN